jgi:hypothetical protein
MVNGWKVTAIIFIILFILETLAFVGLLKIGYDEITNENKCSMNVCADYDSYQYNTGICYCFDNGEIALQEYLG